jgi:xanthine dehydrogenase YagS FAD-binding subunit
MRTFEHVTAVSTRQAIASLGGGAGDARIIAGGTELLPLMYAGLIAPSRLIDLKPANELRYLRFADDGTLRIGALARLAEVERSAEMHARLPLLVQAAREAATPQLRNMATMGGNLLQRPRCWYYRGGLDCWVRGGAECFARAGENEHHAIFDQSPCVAVHPSDLAPALIALDAAVELDGPRGARALPVADFLAPPSDGRRVEHVLQPGELITAVQVPAQPDGSRGVFLKMMERQAWAFALVSVAAQVTLREGVIERARVVLGGVANTPLRAAATEAALEGRACTGEIAAHAAALAVEGATPLRQNEYKVAMARELIRRALVQCTGPAE